MPAFLRKWAGVIVLLLMLGLLVVELWRLEDEQRAMQVQLQLQKLVYDRSARETEKHRHQIRRLLDLATVYIVREKLGSQHPTPEEIADLVYRQAVIGKKNCLDLESSTGGLALAVGGQEGMCGGLAVGYVKLLRSFGFDARVIQLSTEKALKDPAHRFDTHVTAEVLEVGAGDYVVVDPTFNVTFSCNRAPGHRLSIAGMQQCLRQGGALLVHDGKTQLPGRTVRENYLPFERYLFKADVAKD